MHQPKAFTGEFEIEDDAFECVADRFICRGESVSFQLSGFDSEGGRYTAAGTAEKSSLGRFVTVDFRLRYSSDRTDTPARLHIESVDFSTTSPSITVKAIWTQAGDDFVLVGNLSPLRL